MRRSNPEPSDPGETALVTGGAGFLGSHVVDRLLELGVHVVVLDDLSGGFRRNVDGRAEFYHGSVLDAALVERLFAEHRFRWVYHLAAYAAEGLSHFIRRFNYDVNVGGSAILINAAVNHGAECFVFTSSIAVYGTSCPPFSEDTPPVPEDPYGIAKLAVEQDLRAARKQFGLRYVVFRPHNVYGERQNLSDPYRNVVGIFFRQVLAGEPCTVFGDGLQTRAFSYIGDVASPIAESPRVPEAADGIFNLGSDEPHTVLELAEAVQRAVGRRTGILHLPPRHEAIHAHSDHALARRIFAGIPAVALDDGLARMARWAETITPREVRPVGRIEVARGLPPSWAKYGSIEGG